MYGYVYLTKNLKKGLIYVGQHKGAFDPMYFGSGSRACRLDLEKIVILTMRSLS